MNTTLFILFIITASTSVATPGPGVLMTIMKTMEFGFKGARFTVLGTVTGCLIMAILSSSGLSLILASSHHAYSVMRVVGALYMIRLGLRNWRVKTVSMKSAVRTKRLLDEKEGIEETSEIRPMAFFLEGITLQLTNPLLIMFLVSLFPQFIDPTRSYALQATVLSITYVLCIGAIHSGYSFLVMRFAAFLTNPQWMRWIYRVGGTVFIALAVQILVTVVREGW